MISTPQRSTTPGSTADAATADRSRRWRRTGARSKRHSRRLETQERSECRDDAHMPTSRDVYLSARQPRVRVESIALLASWNVGGCCAGRRVGLMMCGPGVALVATACRSSVEDRRAGGPSQTRRRCGWGSDRALFESIRVRSRTDSCWSSPPTLFGMEIDGARNGLRGRA